MDTSISVKWRFNSINMPMPEPSSWPIASHYVMGFTHYYTVMCH